MIINEKPMMRLVKAILYTSNKTMSDLSNLLGLTKEVLQRRGEKKKGIFTVEELIKICKFCGYDIYIEKPDIRINISEYFCLQEDNEEETKERC